MKGGKDRNFRNEERLVGDGMMRFGLMIVDIENWVEQKKVIKGVK